MDCTKTGKLILELRHRNNMTQADIARQLNISEQAVSKWERGLGCPDVSLLSELADIFRVNIASILKGEIDENDLTGGTMKKLKFYVCDNFGNFFTAADKGEITCCSHKLEPLEADVNCEKYISGIENVENDFYITFNHSMTKENYISFVAYVICDKAVIIKLYPEQNPEVRFTGWGDGELYFYSTQHGLMKTKLSSR